NIFVLQTHQHPRSTCFPYTTLFRSHNKYYLYFLKQGRNGDHFFLSSRESGDRAWKTEEELQAWIRTYRGIVSCFKGKQAVVWTRSEEHTSELQSRFDLVCRLLLEKK